MQRLRFWFLILLLKDVENEGPFPDSTRNEVAEAGNVVVRHMIVPNATIPPIADVVLCEEILLIHLPLGSIGRGMFARSPEPGQIKAMIRMNNEPDRLIQILDGDMALIDPGDVATIHGIQRPSGLTGAQVAAEAKDSGQVPRHGILQFAVVAGNRAKRMCPVEPLFGMCQHVENADWLQAFGQGRLQFRQSLWDRLLVQGTNDRFALLNTHIFVWEGCVRLACALFQPDANVLDESFALRWQFHQFAIVDNLLLISLPGDELVP